MSKRGRVTYLVLLAVGAIEDHMTPHPVRAPEERGRARGERSLVAAIRPGGQGGLSR